MQNVALPIRICSKLDKLNRDSCGVPHLIGKKCTWLGEIKFVNLKIKGV